jgi:hypothetical protein
VRRRCHLGFLVVFGLVVSSAHSRAADRLAGRATKPEALQKVASVTRARATDVSSPKAILTAAYDVISGPAGKKRDWNRFRSLFASGARLVPVSPMKEGGFRSQAMSPGEYVTRGDPYFEKHGFFEREIASTTERWANIAQVFSTYESRHESSDATPFERGINSFQLFFDGHRWWIVTILWQGETPEFPLTPQFLPHRK